MTGVLDDWAEDWIQILVRDKFKCVYCGLDGANNGNAFRQLVVCLDHLVPRSSYNKDTEDIENRVTCCWACNRAKSDFNPADEEKDKGLNKQQQRLARIGRVQERLKKTDDLSDYFTRVLSALKQRSAR
ncbi:MAG: HNH endonuclease signature motif containing protein [Pseudolabrys sp.]|jgi:hypothetical protein